MVADGPAWSALNSCLGKKPLPFDDFPKLLDEQDVIKSWHDVVCGLGMEAVSM
jgi:hypothetical protein